MKNVGGPEAKEISISGDTTCKKCLDIEAKAVKTVEKLKRGWDGKINKLIQDALKEVATALKSE